MSGLYGINGINSLGSLGFGVSPYMDTMDMSSGMYTPYASTMGMGGLGYTGMMGMPGMMGMMTPMLGAYPEYMKQMTQAQQDIETSAIQHSSAMHNLKMQQEVNNYKQHDNALFTKALQDYEIDMCIRNINEEVEKGDTKGIVEAFFKAKSVIYAKYSQQLLEKGNQIDAERTAASAVEELYNQKLNKDLRTEIQNRCDSSFTLGFKQQLLGIDRRDNSEEVLNKLFDTNIKSKKLNSIERGFGRATASTIIGLGIGGVVHGISKLFGSKHGGKIGLAAALITGIGNFIWQNSN